MMRLQPIKISNNQKRRQGINRMDIEAVKAKIEIVEMIFGAYEKNDFIPEKSCGSIDIVDFITGILMRDKNGITRQEIQDVTMEIHRLSRYLQWAKMQSSYNHSYYYRQSSNSEVKTISDTIKKKLNNKKRYVKNKL